MKIDKKTIDMVLKMDDEQLWKTIQYVAKKSGQNSFSSLEKPKDMTKIRKTLSALSSNDIQKAIDMMKGEKNGK